VAHRQPCHCPHRTSHGVSECRVCGHVNWERARATVALSKYKDLTTNPEPTKLVNSEVDNDDKGEDNYG